jgi:DNA-binding HxlR family transcriptional regulator
MPDYVRFCPISLASSVVADRWTPLILRELVLGSTRFNDIARGLPGISRSLLVQRLKHLERSGVVEKWPLPNGRGSEYHLTPAGKDLEPVLMALGRWAVHWLFQELRPHEVDPITLTWWMHRRVARDALPEGRVVLQFDYADPERLSIWMVFERQEPSVCVQHPGFEPDLVVRTTTPALAEVFQGFVTWSKAVADGTITVAGPPGLVRALPRWFEWSPFAIDTLERVALEVDRRAAVGV